MAIDEDKLQAFLGRAIGDLGAAMSAMLVLIGDELGLYSALARGGPGPPPDWPNGPAPTNAMYASGWPIRPRRVCRVRQGGGHLPPQRGTGAVPGESGRTGGSAGWLCGGGGPVSRQGARVENFRTGAGMEWGGEHHPCLFRGTERFFRAGYHAHLLSSWLPALDGVVDKLRAGAGWPISAAGTA